MIQHFKKCSIVRTRAELHIIQHMQIKTLKYNSTPLKVYLMLLYLL